MINSRTFDRKLLPGRGGLMGETQLSKYMRENNIPLSEIPESLRITKRDRFRMYMSRKGYLKDLEAVQALVSVLFAILYIIESYGILYASRRYFAISVIDLVLSGVIVALYFFNLIMAKDKISFMFLNPYSLLDYVTVIPVVILYGILLARPESYKKLGFYGVLRVMRLLRLLLLLNQNQVNVTMRGITRKLFSLILVVVSLIILNAGIIQTVENYFGGQSLYLHDAIYFIWVTMTTVGYGDIAPKSIPGKLSVIVFFMIGIVVIPYQLSNIYSLVTSQDTMFLMKNYGLKGHIIVSGYYCRYSDVIEFVKEFFHEQHGNIDASKKIVLVFKDEVLCTQLSKLSIHPMYINRVTIYRGDITDNEVLNYIKIDQAIAVFLLNSSSNASSADHKKQDTFTLMATLAVKAFHPQVHVHAQVLLTESKSLLIQAGASQVLCSEDLKLKLMALSVVCPGLSTLVSNLITSITTQDPMSLYEKKKKITRNIEKDRWIYEYFDGLTSEIYSVAFSHHFVDSPFLDAALLIYQEIGCILFAVWSERQQIVIMNPHDYIIQEHDEAIVVADSIYHAYVVSLFKNVRVGTESSFKSNYRNQSTKHSKTFRKSRKNFEANNEEYKHSGPFADSTNINTIEDEKNIEDDYFHYKEQQEYREKKAYMNYVKRGSTDNKREIINISQLTKLLSTIAPIHDVKQFFTNSKSKKSSKTPVAAQIAAKKDEKKYVGKALEQFNLLLSCRSRDDFTLKKRTFSKHIIVAGNLKGAAYITLTLRSSARRRFLPIIFMHPDESIFPFLYERLKFFDNVYFMVGTPSEKYDLRKAGAAEASCVLYISEGVSDGASSVTTGPQYTSDSSSISHTSSGEEIYQVDSEAVKCVLGLRWIEKKTRYLCEISDRTNIKYFKPSIALTGERFRQFRDVLEDVFSETFEVAQDVSEIQSIVCTSSEAFCSGRVFPNSIFARLLCQSYYNPRIVTIIENMCGFSGYYGRDISSIFQLPCPSELVGKDFKDAFLFFYRHDAIALGLFRPRHVYETNNNRLEYVYANPKSTTVLTKEDKFYVIGNKEHLSNLFEPLNTRMNNSGGGSMEETKSPKEKSQTNLLDEIELSELSPDTLSEMRESSAASTYTLKATNPNNRDINIDDFPATPKRIPKSASFASNLHIEVQFPQKKSEKYW